MLEYTKVISGAGKMYLLQIHIQAWEEVHTDGMPRNETIYRHIEEGGEEAAKKTAASIIEDIINSYPKEICQDPYHNIELRECNAHLFQLTEVGL